MLWIDGAEAAAARDRRLTPWSINWPGGRVATHIVDMCQRQRGQRRIVGHRKGGRMSAESQCKTQGQVEFPTRRAPPSPAKAS